MQGLAPQMQRGSMLSSSVSCTSVASRAALLREWLHPRESPGDGSALGDFRNGYVVLHPALVLCLIALFFFHVSIFPYLIPTYLQNLWRYVFGRCLPIHACCLCTSAGNCKVVSGSEQGCSPPGRLAEERRAYDLCR